VRYALYNATIGVALLAATLIGVAAAQSAPSATSAQADSDEYTLVTSDLMNAVIQPRHIKLWLAGKSQNWTFAEYERHNIGGALGRMAKAIPKYKGMATADLVQSFSAQPLADLATAIKAKNGAAFADAYNELTTGCNGCHQATGHQIVVIKAPDTDPFPDQDFSPTTP
jgi:hypothetical protein